jgi:hypothetical protein
MDGPTYLTECESFCGPSAILLTKIFFSYSVNVIEGEPIDREMTTGKHTVRDISCCRCRTVLGWKYVRFLLSFLVPKYIAL